MTITWPATLPQYFQAQGYSEQAPDQTAESSVDAGPPKVRRRFTTAYVQISGVIRCNATQFLAFKTFYTTTCAGGSLPFTWYNPITQAGGTFRFRRPPPKYTPFGAGNVDVAINLYQTA